ncbi:Ras-related protein Rab-26 [Tritrichomonas foetus]|uniref:Ras-related protein Rab-26 n=1 Tax=Tritrichomonas foetus TaxID=1144522 RepID=A0A1J4KVQ6_9EUKA|nr:Ras-related protein Rab-26 [Tritrichomonas foetus]|eukprot:OHT15311.1 Ras-related protein Rab-26 [Tritrichomonas foetus]
MVKFRLIQVNIILHKIRMSEGPRIIFVGDSGVGKTTLIYRMKTKTFLSFATPTIGTGVTPITINYQCENDVVKKMNFQLWDTAGQEIYGHVVPIYFRNAKVAIVCFSVDNLTSLNNVKWWMNEVRSNNEDDVPILVVGTKNDIPSDNRISQNDVQQFERENNIKVLYTSSSTGENVDELMDTIVAITLETSRHEAETEPLQPNENGRSCC